MTERTRTTRSSPWKRHVYKMLAGAAAMLLATGTVTYHFLEDWGWVDSLYFSTVAITTVGFGDLTPTSDESKLFTVFYILTGIGLITTYLQARLQVRGHQIAAIRGELAPDEDAPPSGH